MSDYINRQDAIDAWWHDEVFFGNQRDDMTKEQWLDYITDVIESLPSAQGGDADINEVKSPFMQQSPDDGADLISRQDALKPFCIAPDGTRIPEVDCDNFPVEFSVEFIKKHLLSLPSAETPTDLISRESVLAEFRDGRDVYDIMESIEQLPSADRPTTDCTEFMEWLKAEVLDENNWELNAVAYGEIICRKLKKLGWIDVEDGCYVDTRPTGKWKCNNKNGTFKIWDCSECGISMEAQWNYCPNCGAKMFKGGEEE